MKTNELEKNEAEITVESIKVEDLDKMDALSLIKAAKKLVHIKDIVESYGIELKRMGSGVYVGLCPFHDDSNADSFKVYDQSGRYCCYVCGKGGDVVDFVAEMNNIGRVQAAKILLGMVQAHPELVEIKKKRKRVKYFKKKDAEYLSKVYACFVEAAGDLTGAHLEKIKSWGLAEFADQSKEHFFEWPNEGLDFWRRMQRALKKAGLMHDGDRMRDILAYVPGFYWDKNKDTLRFTSYGGIGIVERDYDRNITGVQCRVDEKQGSRYKLFSSGFADSDADSEPATNGASIVTIPDVLLTENPRRWIITEGHKKALVLRREKNVNVLSLNGVTALEPAEEYIRRAKEAGETVIDICFDADAREKRSVAKAAQRLADLIEEKSMDPRFLVWPGEYGKGVDDYYLNEDAEKPPIIEVSRAEFEAVLAEHFGT